MKRWSRILVIAGLAALFSSCELITSIFQDKIIGTWEAEYSVRDGVQTTIPSGYVLTMKFDKDNTALIEMGPTGDTQTAAGTWTKYDEYYASNITDWNGISAELIINISSDGKEINTMINNDKIVLRKR